jgi:hypothetical protein
MSGAPDATLSEAELLTAWEEGAVLPSAERALPLLRRGAAATGEDVRRWPLGRHDALLLDLHERAFGATLTGTSECPACGEEVELSLGIDQLRTSHADKLGAHELDDAATGHHVRFRLLCADDLFAAAREPDAQAAERALLTRCVLDAEAAGEPVAAADLPQAVTEELGRRMAAADPQGELRLQLGCPECGADWTTALDPAAFVWRELDQLARSTLVEVASLAAAYGWSESEVLALSRERRRAYLELAGA